MFVSMCVTERKRERESRERKEVCCSTLVYNQFVFGTQALLHVRRTTGFSSTSNRQIKVSMFVVRDSGFSSGIV